MWSYYGSKSKLVRLYPRPIYETIIEPFAGTARYSLYWYFGRNVILIDKYEEIVKLWKWLQTCTPDDILSLPDLGYKDPIPQDLPEEKKMLLGFMVAQGEATPYKKR